jgi:hypothetical protein
MSRIPVVPAGDVRTVYGSERWSSSPRSGRAGSAGGIVPVDAGLELVLSRLEGGGEIAALRVGVEPCLVIQAIGAVQGLGAGRRNPASTAAWTDGLHRSEGSTATFPTVQTLSEAGLRGFTGGVATEAVCLSDWLHGRAPSKRREADGCGIADLFRPWRWTPRERADASLVSHPGARGRLTPSLRWANMLGGSE